MHIACEQEMGAAPEKVFPWIADPKKAMQWQKDVKGGTILEEKPGKIGTTFTEIIEEDGGRLEMKGRITEFIPDKVIAFHLDSRIHSFDVTYSAHPLGRKSKVTVEADVRWKFPMNIASLFLGKRIKEGMSRQIQSELLELKKLCEAD